MFYLKCFIYHAFILLYNINKNTNWKFISYDLKAIGINIFSSSGNID